MSRPRQGPGRLAPLLLLAGGALLLAGSGCKGDACQDLPPQVEIAYSLSGALGTTAWDKLQVGLRLGSGATRSRTLTRSEAGFLDPDGRFVVRFGTAVAGGETLSGGLSLLGSTGGVLAQASFGPVTLSADACNYLAVSLGGGGPQPDGGVPAIPTRRLAQNPADLTLTGEADRDGLSSAITCALSGGNAAELVLAAPEADGPMGSAQPDRGRVYVIQVGALSAGAKLSEDLATVQPAAVIHGAADGDRLGSALGCGDLNGDGAMDLLIGAPDADDQRGRAYVLLGGSLGKRRVVDLASASLDGELRGQRKGDSLGAALAGVYFEGNGKALAAVGAPGYDGPGDGCTDCGAAFLVPGSLLSATTPLSPAQSNAVASLAGAAAGEELGQSLARGDVNGDGKDDLIAGAPGAKSGGQGAVYVLRGQAIASPAQRFSVGGGTHRHSLTVRGPAKAEGFGSNVLGADLTDNTHYDLIIGAPLAARVYLVVGDAALLPAVGQAPAVRRVAAGEYKAVFTGAAGSLFGSSLAFLRTSLFDMPADLLVGAPGSGGGSGAAYWVRGRSAYGKGETVTVSGGKDVVLRLLGPVAGDGFGAAVAGGKLNSGSNMADIVVSAPLGGGLGRVKAGQAFVVVQ